VAPVVELMKEVCADVAFRVLGVRGMAMRAMIRENQQ